MTTKTRTAKEKVRKIRVKRKGERAYSDLTSMTPTELAGTLSEVEVETLIDIAARKDAECKDLTKSVKKAKAILLKEAEASGWKSKTTSANAEAKISPSTSTSIPVEPFIKLLHKMKKVKQLKDFVAVKVGDAKKYLGDDVLETIWDVNTEKYGSVSLKQK